MSESPLGQERSRRGFLEWIIRICGAITGLALVGPVLAYVWPGTRKGPVQQRQEVGPEEGWAVWTAQKASLAGKPVIVVRLQERFRAFSATCTHLGCLIHWNGVTRVFECPCHAATFDQDGKVTGGPPPRPLAELKTSVVQGKVFVSA